MADETSKPEYVAEKKFDRGERSDRGDRDRGDRGDGGYRGDRDKGDRGDRGDRDDRRGGRKPMRRKNCLFCADGEEILDWKNVEVLSGFVTEHFKIVPRRISYVCAKHQRKLTTEIKRSRQAALMGYTLLVD